MINITRESLSARRALKADLCRELSIFHTRQLSTLMLSRR